VSVRQAENEEDSKAVSNKELEAKKVDNRLSRFLKDRANAKKALTEQVKKVRGPGVRPRSPCML
jgi:hypothetical protein